MRKLAGVFTVFLMVASVGLAQTLTVWHDLGDNGIAWFEELSGLYEEENPGVTVRSISYPTDQWFSKSIAALNTDTAPDLLFNNYERVIRVQSQTGKIADLSESLAELEDTSFLSESDLQVTTYEGRIIILPVQRVQMAFGIRESWLATIGRQVACPSNWSDVLEIAEAFTTGDPDGNGQSDTYGIAIEAANPRDLVHMLDLYTFGTGLDHTVIDTEGNIVINQGENAEVTKEIIRLFTDYGYVAPDSVNYSFQEMYQVIEGGRAGMFRVGDWNVAKWDSEAIEGDYLLCSWPAFSENDDNGVVIGGMRGVAVPENSPNKELALDFAKFMLSPEAQAASLETVGASVRGDFEMDVSPHQAFFVTPEQPLHAYDFPESVHPFYPELEALYHQRLLDVITNPSDLDTFLSSTAEELQSFVEEQDGQ